MWRKKKKDAPAPWQTINFLGVEFKAEMKTFNIGIPANKLQQILDPK